MFEHFFIHSCITITFLFFGGILFKNSPYIDSIQIKLLFGSLSGLLGSILMNFSIQTGTILMDLRHIAILLSALYGGFWSSLLTASIISISRILFFDLGFSTWISVSIIMMIGFFCGFISRLIVSDLKKYASMLIFSTAMLSTGFYIVFNYYQYDLFENVVKFYVPTSLIGGMAIFYLANYITLSNRTNFELKHQAQHDFLTGLKNRRQLEEQLDQSLIETQQSRKVNALLLLDIDFFKRINDRHGHLAGDEVLRELGRMLLKASRIDDYVFRHGGEEFSLLLKDVNKEQALLMAEQIRKTVEKHLFYLPSGKTLSITLSVGLCTNERALSTNEWIANADKALYASKNNGRNKVTVFGKAS